MKTFLKVLKVIGKIYLAYWLVEALYIGIITRYAIIDAQWIHNGKCNRFGKMAFYYYKHPLECLRCYGFPW